MDTNHLTDDLRSVMVAVMPDPSPTQRLADLLLDEPVTRWAARLRADGWSWGRISNELYAAHALHVTAETLRSWCLAAEVAS